MNKRVLGRTGLEVTELAMGGLFIASLFNELEDAKATIHHAVELGINFIDSAPTYGNSEEVIGKALAEIDVPLMISTKFGGRPDPFDPQNRDALLRSFDESLRLLGRDCIDILMIHEPDRPGEYQWWTDWETFTGPVNEVLDELKADGRIRFTGLGGTTAYELPHIINTGRFDVVLTAFNYSLLWREAEHAVLPAARAQNMGIIIGSPLQQGALARRYDEQVNEGARWLSPPRRRQYKALYALVDELEMPLAELAIRFVISNPDISCTLMGARSPAEVDLNVTSVERGPLPAEVMTRLDEIAAMVPFRLFEEQFGLPFTRDYTGPGHAAG